MITPEYLLTLAIQSEQRRRRPKPSAVPLNGLDHIDMRQREQDALDCAGWMDKNNIPEAPFVGPFMAHGILLPMRQSRLTVMANCVIASTNPAQKSVTRPRRLSITAHDTSNGYVDRRYGEVIVINPRVTWVGAGGYWRHTELNSIEEAWVAARAHQATPEAAETSINRERP